ncbi:hypothetical protein JTB14_007691 [Gonioctena quinquepunctata]|nr:hypothetical protein JTB14_007691 [Gonioctena quinquepunctata]
MPISENDFEIAIHRGKNPAPGPDSINRKSMKQLPNTIYPILALPMNACLEFAYFPRARKYANTVMIPKPGISSDLTYKQRCVNKTLRYHLNRARQNPEDNTYIRGNKLFINNRAYTLEELEKNENREPTERTTNSAPSTPNSVISHIVDQSEQSITPTEERDKKSTKISGPPQQRGRIKSSRSGSTSNHS